MHRLITIIGPIASGKTTASQLLARALDIPLLDADLFETNPFLPSYIEDNARWAFTTELFFTTRRIKKLARLKAMLRKSHVLVDSGLIMSHEVYTKNHLVQGTMTAAEWDFFTTLISEFSRELPTPDIVIHLTASPDTQLKRIAARGRSFEAGYTREYLENITDRLSEYSELVSGSPTTTLLTHDTEEYDLATERGQSALLALLRPHL